MYVHVRPIEQVCEAISELEKCRKNTLYLCLGINISQAKDFVDTAHKLQTIFLYFDLSVTTWHLERIVCFFCSQSRQRAAGLRLGRGSGSVRESERWFGHFHKNLRCSRNRRQTQRWCSWGWAVFEGSWCRQKVVGWGRSSISLT